MTKIPFSIVVKVALLPNDLTPEQFRKEVRRIAQTTPQNSEPGFFDSYDDEIGEILAEVASSN